MMLLMTGWQGAHLEHVEEEGQAPKRPRKNTSGMSCHVGLVLNQGDRQVS